LSDSVTPAGRVPLDVIAGAGFPAVVTVKVPALPAVNVVAAALVKRTTGTSPTEPIEMPLPISAGAKKLSSSLKSTPLRMRT
jgi:hypothetical protein